MEQMVSTVCKQCNCFTITDALFLFPSEGVVMSLSKEIGIDMNQLVQLDRRELELFLGSRVRDTDDKLRVH